MADEIWKPIPGWPGYEASDRGRVRSWKWPGKGRQWTENRDKGFRILSSENSNGYLRVLLSETGRKRHESVHILVLETFCGPRPTGCQGAHNDGDRRNNHLSNLRWATPSSNALDKKKHGTHLSGEKVSTSKLTLKEVREIRTLRSMATIKSLSEQYGVHQNTIKNILYGVTWRGW